MGDGGVQQCGERLVLFPAGEEVFGHVVTEGVAHRVIRGSGALMRVAKTGSPLLRALRLARLGGLSDHVPAPKPIGAAVAGIGIRYPAPAGAHPAVGRRVPDLPLADGQRLYTALRGGRFVLVRAGSAEALTTEQIDELKTTSPDSLQRECATQVEVRNEAARIRARKAEPRRPR